MKNTILASRCLLAVLMLVAGAVEAEPRWWKGNTHTHSWWSDGDSPPELIAKWYKEHDYNFLVLSDHNIMQQGEKWYPIDEPYRRPEQIQAAYDKYLKTYGEKWLEVRTVNGNKEVKLKTLDEFRPLFEESEKFIFIKGEEITDRFKAHPVHVNGVNLVELIEPQGGRSVIETIQNNMDAVKAQSEQYAQPMISHLNHPNFYFAQTAEDFFYLNLKEGDGYFEMYNGHSHVFNYGDENHQSAERMWDIVLSKRLGELRKSLIYGVAVDDAHEYTKWGLGVTNPGRGWIMVRAEYLTPNSITEAVKRGDFYNSTGVQLSELVHKGNTIEVAVAPKKGVSYTIEFVGTLTDADLKARSKVVEHTHFNLSDHEHKEIRTYSDDIGKVLKSVSGAKASYKSNGDELYVRVRIASSKKHPNPFKEGDVEMAWSQPFVFSKD